jgi:hypothetical protein
LITNPNTASNAGSELCSAGAADPRRLGDLLRDAVGLIRVAEQEDEFHLFQRATARGAPTGEGEQAGESFRIIRW